MTTPDLSALSIPDDAESIEETILALAVASNLPARSWQPGSVFLVLTNALADGLADVSLAVARIANNGIIGLARGLWVPRLIKSHYDEQLKSPVFTVGQVQFVDHGGGPHTITNGQFLIGTESGLQFRVVGGGGTLPLNGTLGPVIVRATAAAAKFNVANNSINQVVTAAPTATVSNPPIGTTGTWITTLGADVESDIAASARVPLKWATLSTGSPPPAYKKWALDVAGVTRATVDDGNPDGPNSVRVYIDNAGAVAAVQAVIDGKKPSGTKVTVHAATTENLGIPAAITVARAYRTAAQAAIEAGLVALANSTDIGGLVIKSEIIERIMAPDSGGALTLANAVRDVAIGSAWTGNPNKQLGASAIPQFTFDFTWIEV